MTQKDLKMALSRIQRSGMKTKRDFNLRKVLQLLINWRVWLFVLAYVPTTWQMGDNYFNLWLETLTNSDGSRRFFSKSGQFNPHC